MKKFLNLLVLLSIIFAPLTVLFNTKVEAQAYRGLVIDQFKFDLGQIQRGTSVKKSFTITHDFQQADKKVTLYIRALDFTSDGKSGVPVFVKPGTFGYKASLASWITFDRNTITLDHYRQVETINFTINVPQDAEAGGKYAAVLIGENPPSDLIDYNDDKSQVALAKELGPLVLMTTDGEINKQIVSDDLFTLTIRGHRTKFFTSPPVTIVSKLKNSGNVHIIPRGVIYVYRGDNFQEYESKYEINDSKGYILPGTTREFYADWTEGFITKAIEEQPDKSTKVVTKINWDKLSKFRLGKYKVKLLYSYEDNNGAGITNTADTYFWVIPWQLIALILLIILIFTARYFYKKSQKKHTRKK